MDTDSDIHCSVDILDDEDENKVEIAKKDLTLIFNKINKSLSDLDKLDLGSSDSENHASKSKKNLKEKSEVSFKVNIEENSQAFVASAHPENRIKHKQLRYSPELRILAPSPGMPPTPLPMPLQSHGAFYHHPVMDPCVVHYPGASGSLTSNTSLTPMWKWNNEDQHWASLGDKLCTGSILFYWVIGTFVIIIILLICIILLLT